jgi:hypothetical protein
VLLVKRLGIEMFLLHMLPDMQAVREVQERIIRDTIAAFRMFDDPPNKRRAKAPHLRTSFPYAETVKTRD